MEIGPSRDSAQQDPHRYGSIAAMRDGLLQGYQGNKGHISNHVKAKYGSWKV